MNEFTISFSTQIWAVVLWIIGHWFVTWTFFLARPRGWFAGMWDKGWMLSKVLGLITIPYVIWLVNYLPGTTVRYTSMGLALTVLIGLWVWILYTGRMSRVLPLTLVRRIIILELFLLIIMGVVIYFKGFNPRVIGTEKLMDIAFINTTLVSDNVPPTNPWLAGQPINYYYFGQFIVGVWSLITTIPTRLLYNIWIAFIGAVTFQLLVVLIRQYTHRTWLAFLGGVVTVLGGNIHYVATFLGYWWRTKSVEGFTYWFANATRLIPFTINEYPIYSIVLGDLHAHYLDLPYFVAFLLVVSQVIRNGRIQQLHKMSLALWEGKREWTIRNLRAYAPLFVVGWLLGVMYMTNSWDTITGFVIWTVIIGLFVFFTQKQTWTQKLVSLLVPIGIVGIATVLTVVPFILFYHAPIGGIGLVAKVSELSKWLLWWGGWLLLGAAVMVPIWLRWPTWRTSKKIYILALMVVSLGIVIGCEVIFIKDIFATANPAYQRANTVFKFYYQVWILMGVMMTVGVASLLTVGRRLTQLASRIVAGLLIFVVVVTSASMLAYTPKAFDDFFNRKLAWTLDGYAYIAKEHPGDYEAIRFLNEFAKTNPNIRIVEATKNESYSYYGRISANTGIPTVLGWPFHIVQWHGAYESDVADVNEIENELVDLYTSSDPDRIAALLSKYKVDLVYIGEQEYKHYETELGRAINTTWFQQNCTELFKSVHNATTTFVFDCRNHD